AADVHGLSPVEAFTVDTIVPEPLRLSCELEDLQCDPPADACLVPIKGDFLFHCHIEEHMMSGLGGLVRARSRIWIDPKTAWSSELRLPLDDGRNDLEWADLTRCDDCEHEGHDHVGHPRPHNPCCGLDEVATDDRPHGHDHAHAHDHPGDCDPKVCPHNHTHL